MHMWPSVVVLISRRTARDVSALDSATNTTAVHGLRHSYGSGRVVYFAQGHDMAEFENAQYQGNHAFATILSRCLLWLGNASLL